MTDEKKMQNQHSGFLDFFHSVEQSAIWTIIGVIFLFSFSILIVLIAPGYVDSTWTSPSSPYQVQMYEVADPNYYMSSASTGGSELQYVHHLKEGFTLLSFKEVGNLRIIAKPELEKYITRHDEKELKLTSRLLLLRYPVAESVAQAEEWQKKWAESTNPASSLQKEGLKSQSSIQYEIAELYDPELKEAFSFDSSGGILQDWVDENFKILDEEVKNPYHQDFGVLYVQNPREFRITRTRYGEEERWRYDPDGMKVTGLDELTSPQLGFQSRKDLISLGEHLYAIEGCWYCHTDQTRTLIEDVVLNGSDSYPAPPSSANEFIYQKITFPGTRRIGPDISRVGVKRASRDWHKAHFWAPKTASAGSIMPAFQHFFDHDPRGTGKSMMGIPNYRFEAMYQYLMTKGTRITPPTQAWWLGKDPIKTKEIIEGQRRLP
ncbi:MAG: cbb3-type cytochrome c oxidase subunit II [Parachlamydiaceae bacterium]